jgi:uncharacterized protein YqfA (UPF0365 family)
MNPPIVIAAVVVLAVMLVAVGVAAQFLSLWMRAFTSGAAVTLVDLIGMRLRRVNASRVINARIQLTRAGIGVPLSALESHVLAGGDLEHVTTAVVAAKMRGGTELSWQLATAMDLAGSNAVEFVDSGAHERGQDWRSAPRRRRVM